MSQELQYVLKGCFFLLITGCLAVAVVYWFYMGSWIIEAVAFFLMIVTGAQTVDVFMEFNDYVTEKIEGDRND